MTPISCSFQAADSIEFCLQATQEVHGELFVVLDQYLLPVGTVSRSDLVRACSDGNAVQPVGSAMTRKLATCFVEDAASVVAQTLLARSCSALIVLDAAGTAVGTIGARELGEELRSALSGDTFRSLFGARLATWTAVRRTPAACSAPPEFSSFPEQGTIRT